MLADNAQLDTTIQIVTPENIAFQYRVAGPFQRLQAYLIDLWIRLTVGGTAAIGLLVLFGGAGLASVGLGMVLVIWFLLTWFYGGAFECLWNGQTPGKRVCQLRVLSENGQPINAYQAVLRNILRAVDMLPLVGLMTMVLNDRFQRLGDLVCGTIVVVEDRPWFAGVMRVSEPEAIRLAAQIPPDFQVSRSLARALAVYVQRRVLLGPARRLEIAKPLGETLRSRFGLAPETDLDLLLCALYHRAFMTDHVGHVRFGARAGWSFAGSGGAAGWVGRPPVPTQEVRA